MYVFWWDTVIIGVEGSLGKLEFPKFSECMAELSVDSLMSCGCGGGVSIVLVACWFWFELRLLGSD